MNYKMGSYGHMYTRLQEADTTQHVDILILGSSHAYRGFDPRIFEAEGYRVFVMGSSSQTPLQALALMKMYLPKLQPKMVLYEVYPGIFQNDGVESSLDLLANGPMHREMFKMALQVNHLKTYNVLINDVFREALRMNRGFVEPLQTEEDQYVPGGFVEKKQFNRKVNRRVTPSAYRLDPTQLQAFGEVVDFVEKQDVPFLMIQAPITSKLYAATTNHAEVNQILSSYGQYIDFNGRVSLNDSLDFYDMHHLSQSGVEKFNKALFSFINQVF